eukprot:jgi/Hompol1/5483/HPOL_001983-RA
MLLLCSDLAIEEPRTGKKKVLHKGEINNAIRISNNLLESLADLPLHIESMVKPASLTWLDVSFNNLTTIDSSLLQLPNLCVLYLHANKIENIAEIGKLGQLAHLRNLTLHGNPLENSKAYRYVVLANIPQLRHLDFCATTKQDRVVARTLLEHAQRQKLKQTE